jgi:hypothetical protein
MLKTFIYSPIRLKCQLIFVKYGLIFCKYDIIFVKYDTISGVDETIRKK